MLFPAWFLSTQIRNRSLRRQSDNLVILLTWGFTLYCTHNVVKKILNYPSQCYEGMVKKKCEL